MQLKNLIAVRKNLENEVKREREKSKSSIDKCVAECMKNKKKIRAEEQRKIRGLLKKIEEAKRKEKSYRLSSSSRSQSSKYLQSRKAATKTKPKKRMLKERLKDQEKKVKEALIRQGKLKKGESLNLSVSTRKKKKQLDEMTTYLLMEQDLKNKAKSNRSNRS